MFCSWKLWIMLTIVIFFTALNISAQEGWFWQYPKPQGNSLNDIYIFNNDIAIAVGGMGTVIKTRDGGETWDVRHHATGTSNSLKSVWFIDDHSGWMVDNQVAFKTVDGGDHWFAIYNGTECMPSNVHFLDENTGFVFGRTKEQGYGYGICCKTVNGGKSWSCSRFPSMDLHEFNSCFFTGKDTGWIVGSGFGPNEIYKTTDCGETWRQQHITPEVYGCRKIQFINSKTGFMVAEFGAFLKTVNGGETWQYQNLIEKYQKDKYQFFYSVYFVDSLHGWIVGGDHDGYILRTTDGGENWIEEDMDIPSPLHEVSFSDSLHGWVVGQFGLIYRTTDGGEEWISQRERQYSFNSIYFINENTGWAVGDNAIILHTSDGGEYWYKQNEADSILLSSVYVIDALNVFAVGSVIKGLSIFDRNGIIFITINGGQIWERQTFDTLYGFNSIVFTNDSTGWITVSNGTLLKTTDKGNTWGQFASGLGTTLNNIQFINETTGWISFYAGKSLLKTIDGWKNWSNQFIDSSLSMYSFYFVDSNKGWAVGSYSGKNNIFKTTDGDNWISAGTPPISHYSSVYFINENIGWVVGGFRLSGQLKSTIIKTTDSGNTWYKQKSPSTNELSEIYFLHENTGWAIGDGIFKTVNGGDVVSVKNKEKFRNNFPEQIDLFQNYPNPFNPTTIIRFQLSSISSVKLKIFNILGREIATLVDERLDAGSHRVILDASQMTSGIYFYRLQACSLNSRQDREFMKTKKMILLH